MLPLPLPLLPLLLLLLEAVVALVVAAPVEVVAVAAVRARGGRHRLCYGSTMAGRLEAARQTIDLGQCLSTIRAEQDSGRGPRGSLISGVYRKL